MPRRSPEGAKAGENTLRIPETRLSVGTVVAFLPPLGGRSRRFGPKAQSALLRGHRFELAIIFWLLFLFYSPMKRIIPTTRVKLTNGKLEILGSKKGNAQSE